MSTSIAELFRKAVHVAEGDTRSPESFTIEGWIRTSRFAKSVTFIHLYDGSTSQTVQIVIGGGVSPELKARLGVGAALRVQGRLVPSRGSEQDREIKCVESDIEVVGDCDASTFPVQKKEATPEYWRGIPHLRVRAAEYQRIFMARSVLSQAVHGFFTGRGFHWVHTPIITFSDCEGAGEMFRLTTDTWDLSKGGTSDEEIQFFGKPAHLTVSGQLEVETFCMALSKVYTFGPTFRSENSHTSRHASEFWMVEPEIAFASLTDVMDLAESFVMSLLKAVEREIGLEPSVFRMVADRRLEQRKQGLAELHGESPPPTTQEFARCTYTEAQEILAASGREFKYPIGWGESLQAEHERYLAEEHFGKPTFVTHYPMAQKPFYMRVTDDCEEGRQTVECFDLLVPGVGEIIGGSAREERLDVLLQQMERHGIDLAEYDWYIDLRRYGTVPHGGFGLGLERMLMWVTGTANIRDVLPFPRTPA